MELEWLIPPKMYSNEIWINTKYKPANFYEVFRLAPPSRLVGTWYVTPGPVKIEDGLLWSKNKLLDFFEKFDFTDENGIIYYGILPFGFYTYGHYLYNKFDIGFGYIYDCSVDVIKES